MMIALSATVSRLRAIPNVAVFENEPLQRRTRFAIGGPCRIFVEADGVDAVSGAVAVIRSSGAPWVTLGGGTNLIVSDEGFDGIALRPTGSAIRSSAPAVIAAEAGASLQDLVDASIKLGWSGLHTMTGIPGSVGGAVYGNAGAYGRSVAESLVEVEFFDGSSLRRLDNAGCRFRYRESIFKQQKDWVILSASFRLQPASAEPLGAEASRILAIRNSKYPPDMKCAGSIFKNLILDELPEPVRRQVPAEVVREGKVPSAYFLEQAGAKGMRAGGIQVADYHANLIYNTGCGTAAELRSLIADLKGRVRDRFGLELEEEVQYIGFEGPVRIAAAGQPRQSVL